MTIIFCPTCDTLVLAAPNCAACGWQRPSEMGDAGKEIWRAELGRALPRAAGSAVVAGGRFCVSAEDGTIVALDTTSGEIAWERLIGDGRLRHTLTTDGVRLFVGSVDIQALPTPGTPLLALDPANGETLWQNPTTAHSLSAATVDGGTVYFTASDGQIDAADAASGQPLWAARHGAWAAEAPAVAARVIVAGGRDSTLNGYAAVDGALLWRFSAAGAFAGPIRIADGCAYACCWDGCLYALDARAGALRWQLKPERGEGITSAPAIAGGRVFIGSRVYHDPAARTGNGYALLAIDAETGAELWRYETPKHITAAPIAAGDTVLFGADDGTLSALRASDGRKLWQVALGTRIVTPPQTAGDYLYVGLRSGTIHAFRWRTLLPAALEDPHAYRQRGQIELAAVAYALHGDFGAAAAIYERELTQPRHAAQLYEQAGQPAQAARVWEQAGEPRRARELYEKAGNTLDVARLWVDAGELLQAARLYEEQGELARAAALYEQAGDRGKAAELYHCIGRLESARQIWQSLGQWEHLTDALVDDGQLAEAAELLAQHDQTERAATLYEQAGLFPAALTLRVALQHWERVADLAARAGDPLNEAAAHEHLGQTLAAAQAYERAARQALATEPTAEERAATLYEHAARLYDASIADDDLARCHKQIKQLRRLPDIAISGGAQTAFIEFEWNTLNLQIKNTGYGPAAQITITFRGAFDIEGITLIERVAPDKIAPLEIYIRPQTGQYGPKVPLEIAVTYKDRSGGHYALTQRLPLRVLPNGSAAEQQTPLEIDIRSGARPDPQAVNPVKHANQEEIEQQQSLLGTHRRTLAHLLNQLALVGGAAYATPQVVNGIGEAREHIQRIKQVLRDWGIAIADHPNDRSETR